MTAAEIEIKIQEYSSLEIPKLKRFILVDDTYRSQTCRTITFVRHGEGYHNRVAEFYVEGGVKWLDNIRDPTKNPYLRCEITDPPLTTCGREEALAVSNKLKNPEIIYVSPLRRALETAVIATRRLESCKIMCLDSLREETGIHLCDKRRQLSEIKLDFPRVDFAGIESESDNYFLETERESKEELAKRAYSFISSIFSNEHRDVAVFSHAVFLLCLFNTVFEYSPTVDRKLLKNWFSTGEVRRVKVEIMDGEDSVPYLENLVKDENDDFSGFRVVKTATETSKKVCFVRHAQGFHNLMNELRIEFSIENRGDGLLDPPLTSRGRDEAKELEQMMVSMDPEIVLVSPARRCLETYLLSQIRSEKKHRVEILEILREKMTGVRENCLSSLKDCELAFPQFDFSKCTLDNTRFERRSDLIRRCKVFLHDLSQREEKKIVVFSHFMFLNHLTRIISSSAEHIELGKYLIYNLDFETS